MTPDSRLAVLARTARSLRRSPGFVAIAALSLGTALGIATAVFAMMDAMTNPESAWRDVDQLYTVTLRWHGVQGPTREAVTSALSGIKEVAGVSTSRMAYSEVTAGQNVSEMIVQHVRPGFLELLDARPRLGRMFGADEEHGAPVALVSDRLWRNRFGNRATIGDASVSIHDEPFRIVGVLPRGTAQSIRGGGVDVWIPDALGDRGGVGDPVLRLRGAPRDSVVVMAQLQDLLRQWTAAYTRPTQLPFSGRIDALRPDPMDLQPFHRAMIGAAVCVLLIACANVAALMLARGVVRRRDYALRLALGAGRWEIGREVLVEVTALAVVGCAVGALVATWVVGLITRTTPERVRWVGFLEPQWSVRVLGWCALAVIVSISLAGAIPAWNASRTDPAGPLKESGGGTTRRAGTRFRWLVITELALSMTLVMGASLMLKSSRKLADFDFGYDARSLMLASIHKAARDSAPPAEQEQRAADLLARVRALSSVQSAATYAYCAPVNGAITSDLTISDTSNAVIHTNCAGVGADFFSTIGMTFVDGREMTDGDAATGGAVVLGERAARRLFLHERAVGRTVKLGPLNANVPWMRVVGVVRDLRLAFNPFPESGPDSSLAVYVMPPHSTALTFLVRPRASSSRLDADLKQVLRAALPPRGWLQVDHWQAMYYDAVRAEDFLTMVFAMLAAASLALGAAGLFSVVSYVASQRMREFAVRLALGATTDNVLRLVLHEGLVMALGGTAVGAGLGMWGGFLIWDVMWGVYPVDAGALIAGEVVLLVVTMGACLMPALRATRANPVEILRSS